MTSHVIAYRSTELLFGTHTFNFKCFFEDFNCLFMQIRSLSRLLLYAESTADQTDHFANAFVCENVAYGYDVVTTLSLQSTPFYLE